MRNTTGATEGEDGSTVQVTIPRIQDQAEDSVPYYKSDDSKKAVNVRSYFKDNEFTGEDVKQTLSETITDFKLSASQQRLTAKQKAEFFVSAFKGSAKRFYLLNCNPAMTYDDRVELMKKEYDSMARKNKIQAQLESLTLTSFMMQKGISNEAQGLTELINYINILHPQVPKEFQSDAIKLRYLRNALFDLKWAHDSLKKISTPGMNFSALTTALQGDVQFHLEQVGKSANSTFNVDAEGSSDHPADVLYGQYARNPKQLPRRNRFNNRRNGRNNKSFFQKGKKKRLCFWERDERPHCESKQVQTRGHRQDFQEPPEVQRKRGYSSRRMYR